MIFVVFDVSVIARRR